MKRQAGFTIIELVVVIALLGILAAVALPRFIDVTEDAHAASVQGTSGALGSGISLVKAQAIVRNATAGNTVAIDANHLVVNSNRFPVQVNTTAITDGSGSTAVNAAGCVAVWDAALQAGAPTVAAAAGTNIDFVATISSNICVYTYQNTTGLVIHYDTDTGEVAIQ